MQLLFDQNISYKVVNFITKAYPGSKHVKELELDSATDNEIWNFAKNNEFTIVTQDKDFINLIAFLGFPPKIILLKASNYKVSYITSVLLNNSLAIKSFIVNPIIGSITLYD